MVLLVCYITAENLKPTTILLIRNIQFKSIKLFGFFPWNLYPKTVATSVLTFFKDLYKTKFHENYD